MRTIRQLLAGEDEIQLAVRLALLALLIYWSFVVIRPFVPILAWSVVLTVALYPVFSGLSRLLGNRPKLAATILTLINRPRFVMLRSFNLTRAEINHRVAAPAANDSENNSSADFICDHLRTAQKLPFS